MTQKQINQGACIMHTDAKAYAAGDYAGVLTPATAQYPSHGNPVNSAEVLQGRIGPYWYEAETDESISPMGQESACVMMTRMLATGLPIG